MLEFIHILAHPNSDLHLLNESKAESFFVAAVDM